MQEHCTHFDMFQKVTNLDELINLIVVQSNLYAQQNGRKFQLNVKEIMAFLGINHIISINYLRTVQSYWECGQFIGNEGVRNTMTRQRFKDILRNLHLWDNTKSYKNDKGFKILPVINDFNNSFSNAVCYDELQSVDEHKVKFKGRSSIKQYVKKKPVKWCIKFWYRCVSTTRYLLKECRPNHRFNAESRIQQQRFLYLVLMSSNCATKVWVEWI